MLQWLAQFLTAPIVNGFLNAYKAKLAAANAQGAPAGEVVRAAPLAEIEARKSATAALPAELGRMSAKVDEMHAVLMQARGVRWAIIAVAGLVGFLAGLSHWVIAKA